MFSIIRPDTTTATAHHVIIVGISRNLTLIDIPSAFNVSLGKVLHVRWFRNHCRGYLALLFRPTQPDKFMSALSAATGCVINLISGLFLHLHSQTQDRALQYYEPLARLQRVSLAIRMVDAHNEQSEQTAARNLVIQELLAQDRK